MKFCSRGIDSLEVLAPNGEQSILFSSLLYVFNNDKEQALDAYLLSKTSMFMDWYSKGGQFDSNGEPMIQVSRGGEYLFSNGYEFKNVKTNDVVYIKPDISFDIEVIYTELVNSGQVELSNNRLVTRDNSASYEAVSKIASRYPGAIKLKKYGYGVKNNEIYFIEFQDPSLHASLQISPDSNFIANEDSDFYEGNGKKLLRTNTLQREFSSYARNSASRTTEDLLNYIADKVWRERRADVGSDGLLEIREGASKRRISKEQFKELEEKRQKFPALMGKALHALFASKDEKDPIRAKKFADTAEEYRVKAQILKEDFELYAELYPAIKKELGDSSTDSIFNEFTVTLELSPYEFKDKNGKTHPISGIGGTIDRLVRHEDGSYTITDFKTGALSSLGNKVMNYAAEARVKMLDNAMNRNTLNLALYALMLRAKDRSIKFRDINFLKVTKNGSVEKLSTGASFDLEAALKVLEVYFSKHHPEFYQNNSDLFNVAYYFSKDTFLAKAIEEHKTKNGITTEAARDVVIRGLTLKFREAQQALGQFPAKGLSEDQFKKREKIKEEYESLLQQLLEAKIGFNPFKYGGGQYMDLLQSLFGNRYGQSNTLISSLNTLYAQAKQRIREEFIDIRTDHDKYLKAVLEEQKTKKRLIGANYEEVYNFMWFENKGELEVITYKEKEAWSKLSKAQKEYADFFRWSIRLHLFKTMNPSEGIEFIDKELAERTDLTEAQRNILKSHKDVLSKLPDISRFKQTHKADFIYREGWVPRVARTREEYDNLRGYISNIFKSNFILSDEEAITQTLTDPKEKIEGLPLKFMGSSEDTAITHADNYTFNFEIMFNAFVSHMISKEHLDDVYNIGIGIKNFMDTQDKFANRNLNQFNKSFVDSFLQGLVLGRRKNFFTRTVRVGSSNVDVDHAIRSLRSYFGVTTLALNVLGAVGQGINQSLKTMQAVIVGSVGFGSQDMDWKASRKMFREIIRWKKDQVLGRVSGTPEALEVNKMALFLNLFGFLPKSYNYYDTGESHTKLLSKQGFLAPSWVNNDLLLKLYSSVDNLNYATYLAGQLYKMTTTVKGKKVSMWDAYEVVNGKLTYIGDERGIDANTGIKVGKLTAEEIDKLRAFAERDMGPYREDERSSMDNSSLGSLYMMFKRWFPVLIRRSFKGQHKNITLGQYVNSNGEIDPETGLPVLRWMPRIDEGFVISFMKFLDIFRMVLVSRKAGTFSEEWKKFSPAQKENVAYAILRLLTFFTVMAIISSMFGDADEDDKNKIKRASIRVAHDTVFEFGVFDLGKWKDTIVSAPALEKLIDTTEGYLEVFTDSAIPDLFGYEPNTVQSGDYKGWYKGLVPALRGTKYASTIFGFWELGSQWEDLDDDLNKTRMQ